MEPLYYDQGFIQRESFFGGGGGGGGGGKLQEVGVTLYTFLYNCPKLGGRGKLPPAPPLDETLMALRTKDTSIIQMAFDGPKWSAIETCTYLTSELRTPLYSVLWMHYPAPNGHIAQLTNSIIWSGPRPLSNIASASTAIPHGSS